MRLPRPVNVCGGGGSVAEAHAGPSGRGWTGRLALTITITGGLQDRQRSVVPGVPGPRRGKREGGPGIGGDRLALRKATKHVDTSGRSLDASRVLGSGRTTKRLTDAGDESTRQSIGWGKKNGREFRYILQ